MADTATPSTIEDTLGPAPQSVEDMLGPKPTFIQAIMSGRPMESTGVIDDYIKHTGVGRILDAFGQGASNAWGAEGVWSPGAEDAMRKAGIFNDVDPAQRSLLKSANEALIRPLAAGLDAAYRAGGAVLGGYQAAATQAGVEVGVPEAGRFLAGLPEAFPTGLHDIAGVPRGATAPPLLPEDFARAREMNVIGPGGDDAWKGITGTPPANENVVRQNVVEAKEAAPEPGEAQAVEQPPKTVDSVAREVDPHVFAEYDPLVMQRDSLREQIADMANARQREIEAQAPHAEEIADLQSRLEDTTPRLAKKYQARLDEMIPERDAWLADHPLSDTPEMAATRQQLMEADYRMRDLSPQVTAAYAEASKQMAPPEVEAPVVPQEAAESAPVGQAAEPAAEPPVEAPGAPVQAQPVPAPPLPAEAAPPDVRLVSIVDDVAKKLVAAGRPVEEAQAAASLVQAHYEARAERFQGALGTPEEMYQRDAPDIRAGTQPARVREMAQGKLGSINLKNGGAVIKLMKDANASTFLHETGHAWAEELLSDAKNEKAPPDLVKDATAVRSWLGSTEDRLTTRQHEKFARGFERYMMEGVAPTRGLAGVFEKFKGWLTQVYQTVAGLKVAITPDIRDVFDRLLTTNVDRGAVAPEPLELREPIPERGAPKRYTPFETVPKEPTRLVSFLRKMGGVQDVGGDIRHTLGGAKYMPGLISETVRTLDDAALMAWEHGYFPELGDRPSINDLLNAIEGDLKGEPRYSVYDAGRVEDFHNAQARNTEIERLGEEHGIQTRGLTREQFYARLTEKMGRDKAEAEQRSLEDAVERDGYELHVEARDWEEHHGIEAESAPRSLEDLEREHKAENVASERERSPTDRAESGRSGGPAPDGQGSAGQGRGGSGAGRRTGESVDANEPWQDSPSDLIDKAGNIRLDNLNTPEDVSQVIREAAAENNDFLAARRGVISDAQVLQLSDALGMDPAALNLRQLGQAFNAEQIMSARKLLVASATFVRDAMAKAANGGDADVMAYAEARARHLMIQEQVSGVTAEAGRALRAFRNIEGMKDAEALSAFLKQETGRTLFQMKEEAALGAKLETPGQVSKFLQDTQKSLFQKIKDIVLAYFINNLISGPLTHAAYGTGNATFAMYKATAETTMQAAIGAAREAITGDATDRVYFGEAGAQMYGMWKGFRDGLKPGVEAFKTGIPVLPEGPQMELAIRANVRQQAIPGPVGYVLETPSRSVSAIHTVFYTMAYEQEIARQAYRSAAKAGLRGTDFDTQVARFTQSPPAGVIEAAHEQALEQVLMNRPKFDSAQYHLSQLVNQNFFAKLVMPFMQIGMNILDQGIVQRTGLAMLSADARADVMGRNGPGARDLRLGKIAVGSMLGIATVSLAAEGLITGGGPSDQKQRRVLEDSGWKAYSIRWGDTFIPYRKFLGPLGPLVSLSADMYEIRKVADEKSLGEAGAAALFGLSEVVADETWMAGLSSFIDAARNWDTKGEAYIRNLATDFIPFSVGMSQITRQIDPYMRRGWSITDAFRSKIPFVSEGVEPQIGIWGTPIASHTMLSMTTANHDPVDARLESLEMGVAPVEKKIRGVTLNPEQYTAYATTAGVLAHQMLTPLVTSAGFSSLPQTAQIQIIHETISKAREQARSQVMMRSYGGANDIISQATAAKAKQLAH